MTMTAVLQFFLGSWRLRDGLISAYNWTVYRGQGQVFNKCLIIACLNYVGTHPVLIEEQILVRSSLNASGIICF